MNPDSIPYASTRVFVVAASTSEWMTGSARRIDSLALAATSSATLAVTGEPWERDRPRSHPMDRI